MRKYWIWLWECRENELSAWEVVKWWEERRFHYNIVIGAVGLVSLVFFFIFIGSCHVLNPGEDAVEPLAVVIAPFIANVFYTGGWALELILRPLFRRSPMIGPVLMKIGVGFSLFVVLLPSVCWGSYYLWQLLKV